MKIRVADFKVITAQSTTLDGTTIMTEKLFIRDTDGFLHERFGHDVAGKFFLVELPDRVPAGMRRPARRKRANRKP